jgi:hypothetical protein
MLILDYTAEDILDRYSEFISSLTWFRMYCAGNMGKSKADYLKGFNSLKGSYEELYVYDEEEEKKSLLKWNIHFQHFQKALEKIEKILSGVRLTDAKVHEISSLLWEFESKHEKDFRKSFFEKERRYFAKSNYSTELFNVVDNLLDNGENEEAVLTAFKFLDSHLQKILSVQPHQLHGEDLINHAFAPNSGVLQLGTHPNEQVGLRNFFSGANAVFRNPAAHRFTNYEDFTGETIVAMTAMMARFASELAKKKKANEKK